MKEITFAVMYVFNIILVLRIDILDINHNYSFLFNKTFKIIEALNSSSIHLSNNKCYITFETLKN
jgi:hypothetical protein